jgi:hypothetical protein
VRRHETKKPKQRGQNENNIQLIEGMI